MEYLLEDWEPLFFAHGIKIGVSKGSVGGTIVGISGGDTGM